MHTDRHGIDDNSLTEQDDPYTNDPYTEDSFGPDWQDDYDYPDLPPGFDTNALGGDAEAIPEPPQPIDWTSLTADEAEQEWHALDAWVTWLRVRFSLPPSEVPPYWHRHPELVEELSALRLHWLGAYHPDQHGSGPIGWLRDFADTRHRLRDWVAMSGTTLTTDRATRPAVWPGEDESAHLTAIGDDPINDRAADFAQFVRHDIARRWHPTTP